MNNNDIPLPKDSANVYNENHMQNCNVFQGDIYGACFPLPGAQVTIEHHYGNGQKPTSQPRTAKAETGSKRECWTISSHVSASPTLSSDVTAMARRSPTTALATSCASA